MGSMSKPLRDKYIQRYGKDKWLDHVNKIDSMWNIIEKELDVLNLCYRNVKIYQDGLPNCGNDLSACEDAQLEKNIVNDIAKKGSKNYQLIVRLLDKGANLIGTEDPKLLIEEYKTIRETIQPVGPPAVRQPPSVPEPARIGTGGWAGDKAVLVGTGKRQTAHVVDNYGTGNQIEKTDKCIIDKYKRKAEECLSRRDKYISRRICETLKDDETGILFIGMMHKVNEFLPKDIKIDLLNPNSHLKQPK